MITPITVEKRYSPRQRKWNAVNLLKPISRNDITGLTQIELDSFKPVIWNDLTSEYDSHTLYQTIQANRADYTPELLTLMEPWYADETNHYLGGRQVYNIFYGDSLESITDRVIARKSDLSSIDEFINDEFKLCLLLAYDEIVSTHAYHRDIPFYASLGPQPFNQWIRTVSQDEALHYSNVIRLIQHCHQHRLSETHDLLWKIVNLDVEEENYQGTFVMDHKLPNPQFPLTKQELVHLCAERILQTLTGQTSFNPHQVVNIPSSMIYLPKLNCQIQTVSI